MQTGQIETGESPASRAAESMASFVHVLRLAADNARCVSLASYTLHSGGADGADTAWGREAGQCGALVRHWYWGRRTPCGNAPVSAADFAESDAKAKAAAAALGRFWSQNPWVQNLIRRNWCQAKYADAVFAVSRIRWEPAGRGAPVQADGGTGYAVQMAMDLGKPVHVFGLDEQHWFLASEGWRPEDPPMLTRRFAGIGTRGDRVPGQKNQYVFPEAADSEIRLAVQRAALAASPSLSLLSSLLKEAEGLAPGGCLGPEAAQESAEALLSFAGSTCQKLEAQLEADPMLNVYAAVLAPEAESLRLACGANAAEASCSLRPER